MNSLVGYGLSSDSDSDASGSVKDDEPDVEEGATVKRTRNFLLESGSASSGSEEEDPERSSPPPPHPPAYPPASVRQRPLPTPPPPNPNRLPSPPLNACADSSVFSNPFRAQAEQKLSALQKHVPLTMQAKPSHIGGKRMCVSYRKDGRCRFGIKCKFAHDSDLQTTAAPSDCHPSVNEEAAAQAEEEARSQETKEEQSEGQQGKKRRVGLSNTLIPPKRAMKQYTMQREREQINMSR
ncbi:uncharacterized protein LOC115390348 [Salarias fasciatus]|uniref:uncharacterized protein LOC115390348 n=1 Tax=Salarias fasciatus TaxID=181472 RepID=UPI001176A2A4|nr:uncharacterized protein LOC115390348 [Salarias fasciatus]